MSYWDTNAKLATEGIPLRHAASLTAAERAALLRGVQTKRDATSDAAHAFSGVDLDASVVSVVESVMQRAASKKRVNADPDHLPPVNSLGDKSHCVRFRAINDFVAGKQTVVRFTTLLLRLFSYCRLLTVLFQLFPNFVSCAGCGFRPWSYDDCGWHCVARRNDVLGSSLCDHVRRHWRQEQRCVL